MRDPHTIDRMTGSSQPPVRRRVALTAAWTVPTVAVAAAAPAYAASPCYPLVPCPNIAFTGTPTGTAAGVTSGAGRLSLNDPLRPWSFSANGTGWTNTNATGFNVVGGVTRFSASSEPTTAGRALTLTQTNAMPLNEACRYVITYGVIYWANLASADIVMNVRVGGVIVGSFTTAGRTGSTNIDAGIQSITVPAGSSGAVSFDFLFGGTSGSDDLHLYSPSVSCV